MRKHENVRYGPESFLARYGWKRLHPTSTYYRPLTPDNETTAMANAISFKKQQTSIPASSDSSKRGCAASAGSVPIANNPRTSTGTATARAIDDGRKLLPVEATRHLNHKLLLLLSVLMNGAEEEVLAISG